MADCFCGCCNEEMRRSDAMAAKQPLRAPPLDCRLYYGVHIAWPIDLDGNQRSLRQTAIYNAMLEWHRVIDMRFVLDNSNKYFAEITWHDDGALGTNVGATSNRGDGTCEKGKTQGYLVSTEPALLYKFALHELGHLLGLGHSSDPDSVMSSGLRATSIPEPDILAAVAIGYVRQFPPPPEDTGPTYGEIRDVLLNLRDVMRRL